MSSPRDHYEVLGIPRSAGEAEIKSAYRKLARELHPDRNKAPDAAARFSEVQQAYDVLSDPGRRKVYDQYGHEGPRGHFDARTRSGTGASPWGVENVHFEGADMSDIFESIFGGAGIGTGDGFGAARGSGFGRSATGTAGRARAGKPRDLETTIEIDFVTAALGGKRLIRVGSPNPKDIEVTIPRAFPDAGKLRIRGEGAPSRGGQPGDLILTVRVAKHPYFTRSDLNLELELPVSIVEAALGAAVSVPTLTGKVEIKVPPGTSSGQRLRLKGLGLRDEAGTTGDLFVVIKIVAPPDKFLEPAERATLEKLGQRLPSPRQGPFWDAR